MLAPYGGRLREPETSDERAVTIAGWSVAVEVGAIGCRAAPRLATGCVGPAGC